MNLDEAQKKKVATWIVEGLKLSEIQNRIGSELGVRLTYMEARFLMDDLKLKPKDPEPPKQPAPLAPVPAAADPMGDAPLDEGWDEPLPEPLPAPGAGAAKLKLSIDQLTRPGAMVSGKVTFSDGQKAEWYLDQTGRLGVVPTQTGYKPSQADVQAFQLALQDELAKMGF